MAEEQWMPVQQDKILPTFQGNGVCQNDYRASDQAPFTTRMSYRIAFSTTRRNSLNILEDEICQTSSWADLDLPYSRLGNKESQT